jgi:hypothetical protein
MKLLKYFHQSNRHMKLAVILAPLLAIGGYIMTGILLEKKLEAQPGTAKAMTLKQDCQLLTGVCELLHREIAANIGIEVKQGKQFVYLATSTPIQGALISTELTAPKNMLSRGDPKHWVLELHQQILPGNNIRLVLAGPKNKFFIEIIANK